MKVFLEEEHLLQTPVTSHQSFPSHYTLTVLFIHLCTPGNIMNLNIFESSGYLPDDAVRETVKHADVHACTLFFLVFSSQPQNETELPESAH